MRNFIANVTWVTFGLLQAIWIPCEGWALDLRQIIKPSEGPYLVAGCRTIQGDSVVQYFGSRSHAGVLLEIQGHDSITESSIVLNQGSISLSRGRWETEIAMGGPSTVYYLADVAKKLLGAPYQVEVDLFGLELSQKPFAMPCPSAGVR